MAKRMLLMLAVVAVVLGAVFGFEAFRSIMIKRFLATQGAPVQTVSATTAAAQPWQPQLHAIGSLRAVRGADLSPQVGGLVSAIHFDSGADVAAGALVVELASADDQAKLDSLKALATLAQITYQRDQRQLEIKAVSQQVVDADEQNLKSDQAQVAQQQAIVDYKFIRAPFAGRLGIRQVDVGQYLPPGTAIVTLQALDPIFVDFTLPQQAVAQIATGQKALVAVDTYPGQVFTGTIAAINPRVDTATRNVQVRASLANPDHRLLPGMFATVSIDVGAPQSYITLPQTAITYNPFGSTVYIVDTAAKNAQGQPAPVVQQRFVTTGDTRGDQIAVLRGVTAGETIVTGGQMKLRNGTPVKIDNTVQPLDDPNPHPVEQ